MARALTYRYNLFLSDDLDSPDQIFRGLVDYVSRGRAHDGKVLGAATGIVTHYFELCDIFER
ncbi:hypothetical protein ACFL2Q_07155 [Thermodesulfobacteriota bacterium]